MRHIDKIITIVALFFITCAPTLPTQSLQTPQQWLNTPQQAYDTIPLTREWWLVFNDSTLTRLIEHALESNRDIASSAATVEASRTKLRIARADYLPQISLDGFAEKYRTQTDGRISEYYIEPTLSWEISLFGALRNSDKAARAAIISSQWAMRGVELSITSEIATDYYMWCQALQSLDIAKKSYQLRVEKSALIDSMVHYGMADGVAQEQARSLLYTAAADLSQYRRSAEQIRMVLATLIGVIPEEMITAPNSVTNTVTLPIPPTIPSDVLEHRWDIQQSYADLDEAAANVGIAHAARYPTITLTGSSGILSNTLKGLTQDKPWSWSIAGEIVQPIIGWGKLNSSEHAAVANYKAALMNYEQSMLTALSEVEQAFIAISTYSRERTMTEKLVEANKLISNSVNQLYDAGMNNYLNVLDAERDLYDSQLQLVDIYASQRLSYITLYKALGGDF